MPMLVPVELFIYHPRGLSVLHGYGRFAIPFSTTSKNDKATLCVGAIHHFNQIPHCALTVWSFRPLHNAFTFYLQ